MIQVARSSETVAPIISAPTTPATTDAPSTQGNSQAIDNK